MNITYRNDTIRVVVLDISGIYAQICNQGYFDSVSIEEIKQQFSDTTHWRVIILD